MKKVIILALIVVLFGSVNSIWALDKNEVTAHLQSIMKDLVSISFSFEDVANKKNNGSIIAIKGNKYKISSEDRTIHCNGDKIWNYTRNDNKVLVSDFDPSRPNFSIENVFFGLVDKMEIEQFSKELSSKKPKGLYILTLKPEREFAKKNKISKVKIWMNEKKEILFLATEYNGVIQQWKINNLKFNPKIKADIFNFTAPKDCKIIELD